MGQKGWKKLKLMFPTLSCLLQHPVGATLWDTATKKETIRGNKCKGKGSLTLGKHLTFISFLLSAVVTIDEEPCLLLPLHTREKVEKLLFRGGEADGQTEDSDWCNLAGLLGYEEERIAAFRQEEHPVCALLSDWGGKDSASIDTLCTALRKINRDDVAQSLVLSPNPKPTATSVV